ncbi:MAG: hypothetical protein IKK24_03445, partial [Clostridia bacterium]|nr:hypothetical protein [Clostridia bacterium]
MTGVERTEWMYEKKWGVFIHHLCGSLNDPEHPKSMGKSTGWEETLRDFDCELFASQLHEAGAGWCFV